MTLQTIIFVNDCWYMENTDNLIMHLCEYHNLRLDMNDVKYALKQFFISSNYFCYDLVTNFHCYVSFYKDIIYFLKAHSTYFNYIMSDIWSVTLVAVLATYCEGWTHTYTLISHYLVGVPSSSIMCSQK